MIDVTFLISAHNRGHVLLDTLAHVNRCGLPAGRFETIVVDNASTDGTADLVRHWFKDVNVIALPTNRGPCAKNVGLKFAKGRFVVFLDDDSYPTPGSVARMIAHFDADPSLGAATFTVTLPSGKRECSA
jgi:glycosyltransferase involved in cell wall biosynthesis